MTVLVSGALQFRRFRRNEQGDGSAVPVVQPPLSCSMKLGWVAVHAFPRKNSFSLPRAARCDSAVSSFGSALPPTGFPGPVAGRVSQQGLGRSWSATGEKVQLGPLDGKAGLWSPEPRASPRWSVVSTRAGTASHRLQHASCGFTDSCMGNNPSSTLLLRVIRELRSCMWGLQGLRLKGDLAPLDQLADCLNRCLQL